MLVSINIGFPFQLALQLKFYSISSGWWNKRFFQFMLIMKNMDDLQKVFSCNFWTQHEEVDSTEQHWIKLINRRLTIWFLNEKGKNHQKKALLLSGFVAISKFFLSYNLKPLDFFSSLWLYISISMNQNCYVMATDFCQWENDRFEEQYYSNIWNYLYWLMFFLQERLNLSHDLKSVY